MELRNAQSGTSKSAAFTLVELLVCAAIIGILTTLLIGIFRHFRMGAHGAQCISNLRQIGLANIAFSNDYNGYIAVGSGPGTLGPPDNMPVARRYWWWRLMPYLGADPEATDTPCPVMICPGDPAKGGEGYANYESQSPIWKRSYGINSFVVKSNVNGLPPKKIIEIPRPSKTAYVGDIAWYLPSLNTHYIRDISPWIDGMPTNWHDGRVNIVFLDAHVESLTRQTLRPGQENHWIWTGE